MTNLNNSERLKQAGFSLPAVAKPLAAYVPAVKISHPGGYLVRTSGQLPVVQGQLVAEGLVGQAGSVTVEKAAEAARICALNALAAAASVLPGGLDQLSQVVKVTVFVASASGFDQQAQVANGASDLFAQVFPQGHARSAVGVACLPVGAPVEVEAEFLALPD